MKCIAIIFIIITVGVTTYGLVSKNDDLTLANTKSNESYSQVVGDLNTIKESKNHTKIVSNANSFASAESKHNSLNKEEDEALLITEELENRYRALSENEQFPTLSSRLNAINLRRPSSNYSPEEVLASMEKGAAWQGKNDPGVLSQKLTEEELNDGRQFLDFDQLKIETLMQGDHMSVAVDSIGQVFDMRVDQVKTFDDGNIMWKGTIMNGAGGTVSITQSNNNITVASVILPEDDFTLESHGGDAWIVDSSVLFKIDPHETDFVISPEEIDP